MFDLRWGQTKPPLGAQLNYGHPLAQGLVGCWLMNEGCGDKIYDLSGNGNHGTTSGMTGTATSGWVPGKHGSALAFDGINDYVNCGTLGDRAVTENGPLTISARININAGGGFPPLFQRSAAVDWEGPILYLANNRNQLVFHVHGSSNLYRRSMPNVIIPGTWQCVSMTWDGSLTATNILLYINGYETTYFSAQNGVSLVDNSAIDLTIGKDNNDSYWDGYIDYFYVFNRALSAAGIAQLYQSPFAMFDQRRIWAVALKIPIFDRYYKNRRSA